MFTTVRRIGIVTLYSRYPFSSNSLAIIDPGVQERSISKVD